MVVGGSRASEWVTGVWVVGGSRASGGLPLVIVIICGKSLGPTVIRRICIELIAKDFLKNYQ